MTKWLILLGGKKSAKSKVPTEEVTYFEVGLRGKRGKHSGQKEQPAKQQRHAKAYHVRDKKSPVLRMSRGRKKVSWVYVFKDSDAVFRACFLHNFLLTNRIKEMGAFMFQF